MKIHVGCNWAQILEGQIDSAHSSSLHSSDMKPAKVDAAKATDTHWLRPSTDKAPRLQVERTSYGFHYAAIRRPITNAQTHDYIRMTVYVAPFTALIPPNNDYNVATAADARPTTPTPRSTSSPGARTGGIDQEAWRKFNVAQPGIDLDAGFNNLRTRENDYGQDRDAMKLGDFTGISGIPNQDIAMWETMGPIADRTRERLGASDLAVVEFRDLMVEAARADARQADRDRHGRRRTSRMRQSARSRAWFRNRRTGVHSRSPTSEATQGQSGLTIGAPICEPSRQADGAKQGGMQ